MWLRLIEFYGLPRHNVSISSDGKSSYPPQQQVKAGFLLSPYLLTPRRKAWENWFSLHNTEIDIKIQTEKKEYKIQVSAYNQLSMLTEAKNGM